MPRVQRGPRGGSPNPAWGYVSTDDAAAVGIPAVELAKIAGRGRLRHLADGPYHFDDRPPTRFDQFYEAVRRVGDDAYLTGEAVLALHGLANVNPRCVRVGTCRRVRRTLPDWIEVVEEDIDDEHLIAFELIPTTTIIEAFRACRDRAMSDRLRAAVPVARTNGLLSEQETGDLLGGGLALPEEQRARVAAELFASLESRDPEDSAESSSVWARQSSSESTGSPAVSRRESISKSHSSGSTLRSLTHDASYSSR